METVHDAGAAAAPSAAAKSVTPQSPGNQPQAHLEFVDPLAGHTRRIELNKEVTRLARDPEGEVVIDADAAVVSRRHAEIKWSGDQYSISDLRSFIGTLVDDQRLTETVTQFHAQ